jgi:hypothetical protein
MLDLFGRRVRSVWPDDLGIHWSHIPESCVVRDADALPDLTDAATVGCLLALVRAAWGCAVVTSPEYDLVRVLRRVLDDNTLREAHGEDTLGVLMKCGAFHDTEVAALAARIDAVKL